MMWAASMPVAALALTPITLSAGPGVAFNLLALVAPALSAWTAYLLAFAIADGRSPMANGTGILPVNLRETRNVKRETLRRFLASLIAGYLFGFSSYELAHLLGHLNLVLVFLLPLFSLLVVKRYEGKLSRWTFILLLGLGLALQFGLATEILATTCLIGALTWLVFYGFGDAPARRQLRALAWEIGLALFVMLVLAAPLLFYVLRDLSDIKLQLNDPEFYSADLLNYFVPTSVTQLGHRESTSITARFTANLLEQGSYLGFPLILLLAVQFWQAKDRPAVRALITTLGIVVVLSLGPALHVAGVDLGWWLPWRLVLPVPFIHQALPIRLSLHVALFASIAVAIWLETPGARSQESGIRNRESGGEALGWLRLGVAVVACVFLFPNRDLTRWTMLPLEPFFEPAHIDSVLEKKNANVVMLPYGWTGPSMLWQLQARMRFTQSGGYLGTVPEAEAGLPSVQDFFHGQPSPNFAENLRSFCATHRVTAILIGPGTPAPLRVALEQLGWPAVVDRGITVLKVPEGS